MAGNPRQLTSLDYNDADLYGALNNRPATGIPIDLPVLPDLGSIESNAQKQARLAREYREYETRGRETARQQKEAQAAREREYQARKRGLGQPSELPTQQIPQNEIPRSSLSPLEQMQRSNPERLPGIPSAGSPPPTPGNSSARPSQLVEPTAMPAPAALKEVLPLASLPLSRALPRGLPAAAARLAVPGVAVGLDLAGRLVVGQPVGQAVSGAAGGAIGGGIGALAGNAIFPGLGGVIGFMIGGFVGGAISDAFFRPQLPTTGSPPTAIPNYPPYQGGQGDAALYQVVVKIVSFTDFGNSTINIAFKCRGKILGFGITGNTVWVRSHTAGTEDSLIGNETYGDWSPDPVKRIISAGGVPLSVAVVSIVRADGADTAPDIQQSTPPPDNRPYNDPPINADNTIPTGTPSNSNKGKISEVAPSKMSGGNPRGEGNDWVPSGHLAPNRFPSPDRTPSNLGSMLPRQAPAPMPLPFADPEDEAVPRQRPGLTVTPATITPSTGGVVEPIVSEGTDALGNYHDGKGGYYAPDGTPIPRVDLGSPLNNTPSSSPETSKAPPVPDAVSPTPKANNAPQPKTPEQNANDEFLKKIDEKLAQLSGTAAMIAALTPIINGIPNAIANNPNVRAANRDDVQGAVCEIAQPGGCLGSRHDQTQQQNVENGSRLDAINAALNGGNLAANTQLLAGQATILERLGAQVPGGISGKLERLAKWLHLDRALNILIWWQTLHNAYMLSANLGQTLTSAISNVLAAIGIEDAEGSPLDIGAILGGQFDSLAKTVIGETEWGGIKAEFKKWNRIYQAAANLMNSIQSIGYSILSALEVVGSWVALIGNALRRWGEVSERAYRWMNPTPNFQNKFFTTLEKAEDVVSQIDSVASEVLSVQETVTQIGEQKEQFTKALGEEPQSKQGTIPPEATQVKAGFDASKLVSATGLAISEEDKEADE
ncbi:hypothetical protein H6G93_34440 [Nostoc sp. FACHB-973]|nr:hypothetical protein [Nostoc sp. FACHB-973]